MASSSEDMRRIVGSLPCRAVRGEGLEKATRPSWCVFWL